MSLFSWRAPPQVVMFSSKKKESYNNNLLEKKNGQEVNERNAERDRMMGGVGTRREELLLHISL